MSTGTWLKDASGSLITSAGKVLGGPCCWKQAYLCGGAAVDLWLDVADIPASGVVQRAADGLCYNFPDPATPCHGTLMGPFTPVPSCEDCCLQQSYLCSTNEPSGKWLPKDHIPPSNTIIEDGICYYFVPTDPCTTPGTLHADPPTSVTGCGDLACGDACSKSTYTVTLSGISLQTTCQVFTAGCGTGSYKCLIGTLTGTWTLSSAGLASTPSWCSFESVGVCTWSFDASSTAGDNPVQLTYYTDSACTTLAADEHQAQEFNITLAFDQSTGTFSLWIGEYGGPNGIFCGQSAPSTDPFSAFTISNSLNFSGPCPVSATSGNIGQGGSAVISP